MADKAIGSLVEATVINDADRFVLEQSGQAKQISGATMISELAEALDGHGGIQSIDLVSGEGNVKTYRITFTDGTSYDYEVRDGESGNYAVVARNFAPYSDASGATQSIPFLSQGTGRGNGSATVSVGNYCQLKKKLGNTVCVNQLVKNGTFSTGDTTNWLTAGASTRTVSGGVLTMQTSAVSAIYQNVPLVKGHKYILCATLSATSGASVAFGVYKNFSGWYADNITADGAKHTVFRVIDTSGIADTDNFDVRIRHNDTNSATITIEKVWLVDLSIWHGSTASIPSDLLSYPENWGRYYAGSLDYEAGYLDSADGTMLKSIGRNVWDEEWERSNIDWSTYKFVPSTSGGRLSPKNFIPVIPNATYYTTRGSNIVFVGYETTASNGQVLSASYNRITIPNNCRFLKFGLETSAYGTTYNHDITISLYYSGESGYDQYYPFSVLAEVDTGSEVLRGVEGSRDEKLPSGAILRKRATHTFDGTENFNVTVLSGYSQASWMDAISLVAVDSPYISNRFITGTQGLGCVYGSSGYARVFFGLPTSVTTNAEAQAWFANNPTTLEYELATPTTEQGTAFPEYIPCNPVGSMNWENTNGIPQGAEIFYPYDYAGTLDSMIDALPSADGTYTFKATVASGKITYSWVAD